MNLYDWGGGLLVGAMIAKALEYAFTKEGMLKDDELHLKAVGSSSSTTTHQNGTTVYQNGNASSQKGSDTNIHLPWMPRGLYDACEVAFSLRGYGFRSGKATARPPHARPSHPTSTFLLRTLLSFLAHFLILDVVESGFKLVPHIGTTSGGTMFYPSLPPLQRYAVSTALHTAVGCALLVGFGVAYDLVTLIGVGLFGSSPENWPPVIDNPFRATSLHELWARRWHQLLRRTFIVFGGIPGYHIFRLFGKTPAQIGMMLGTFLASGLYHELTIYAMGKGLDWRPVVFFAGQSGLMMLERLWRGLTGKRVCGFWGGVWVYSCIFVLGQPMSECHCVSNLDRVAEVFVADSWLQRGLAGGLVIPTQISPVRWLLTYLQQWELLQGISPSA